MTSPETAAGAPAPAATPTTALTTTLTSTDRVRRALLAGTLVLAPVLLIVSVPLEVSTADVDAGAESLAIIAADRAQFYASGLLVALGLAMLALSGLAVMALTRGRGGVLGTLGGCVLLVCGTAASAGIFMYTAVSHAMTAPGLDRAAMAELDTLAGDSTQVGLPFFIGFVGLSLGLLLAGAALWRARAVPLFVSIPLVLAGPALFAGGSGWAFALALTPLLALTGVAVELLRPAPRTIVLPDVPAQARPTEHDVASATPAPS